MRSIGSKGKEPGHFITPRGIAAGAGGEIIVADTVRNDLQVFSKEGELLQIIGKGGDSDVKFDTYDDRGTIFDVVTDAQGRLFVLERRSVTVLSCAAGARSGRG